MGLWGKKEHFGLRRKKGKGKFSGYISSERKGWRLKRDVRKKGRFGASKEGRFQVTTILSLRFGRRKGYRFG